jgi:hypothetical protein
MKNTEGNNRRDFLKTAGAALVAASVPAALVAQPNSGSRSANNLKQMIIFGGVSEPLPSLPGTYGQVCYQLQMRADIGGTGGGFGTISDPVLGYVNSHVQFQSGRYDLNDFYVFQGTVSRSLDPDLVGKAVTVKVQVLSNDNCNVSLTIANTPVAGLLLPAIQKVRDKDGR